MDTFTLSLPMLCIICFFVFLADFADAGGGGRLCWFRYDIEKGSGLYTSDDFLCYDSFID